jgi:beta-glucosidase-like glycosyl hydrolase
MGFTGVVISDDMQDNALAGAYSLEERILFAVEAGTDILLFGLGAGASVAAAVAGRFTDGPGFAAPRHSNAGLPDISAVWQPTELVPFQRAIQAAWPGAVMSGHLLHRGLDALRPASLSVPILTDLLRGKMGFTGVVISDDMQDDALAGAYSLEERILFAVEAGTDILLFGLGAGASVAAAVAGRFTDGAGIATPRHSGDSHKGRTLEANADEVHAVLVRLTQQGRISPARIEGSFERISRLKQRFAGWKP